MTEALLFIVLVHFFIMTSTSNAVDGLNLHCPSYNCGNIKIKYPFWKVDSSTAVANQYCGYRGFNLTCSTENKVTLPTANDEYYVKDIDYDEKTLTLVDIDVTRPNPKCPRARHNLSVGTMPLLYAPGTLNLSFYFNCTQSFRFGKPILCFQTPGRQSYVTDDEEDFNWFESCEGKVVTPVMETEANYGDWATAFGVAMNKGFVLNWKELIECGKCESSDGLCGFSTTQNKSLCFCPNGSTTLGYCKGTII